MTKLKHHVCQGKNNNKKTGIYGNTNCFTTSDYEILSGCPHSASWNIHSCRKSLALLVHDGLGDSLGISHRANWAGPVCWRRGEHVRQAAPTSLCLITCLSSLVSPSARRVPSPIQSGEGGLRGAVGSLTDQNSCHSLHFVCLFYASFTMSEEIRCFSTAWKPIHPSEEVESSSKVRSPPPLQDTPAYHGMRWDQWIKHQSDVL